MSNMTKLVSDSLWPDKAEVIRIAQEVFKKRPIVMYDSDDWTIIVWFHCNGVDILDHLTLQDYNDGKFVKFLTKLKENYPCLSV